MTHTLSIIERLQQQVTASLSSSNVQVDDDNNIKTMLDTAYALFLVRLGDAAFVKRLETLADVTQGDALGQSFFSALAHGHTDAHGATDDTAALNTLFAEHFGVAQGTVLVLLGAALPRAYAAIKDMAGTTPIADFVKAQDTNIAAPLPAWLLAWLPVGTVASAHIAAHDIAAMPTADASMAAASTLPEPVSVAAPPPIKSGGNFLKTLLPLVGALILALLAWLLLRSCQQNPTAVAVPSAPTMSEIARSTADPVNLSLALNGAGDAVAVCTAVLGTDSFAQQLHATITGVFSGTNCRFEQQKNTAAAMPALQYLPQILGFMKGVPDASINIVGKNIRLNASDSEALNKLVDTLTVALPEDFVVEAESALDVEAATADAIAAAKTAMEALVTTPTPSLDDLTKALNLQIINFAVDSTDIPMANREILDKAASYLIAMPDAHLRIIGHTDNTASESYNQKLSEARAAAVRDYLLAQGVPAERLETVGRGLSEPVASNATEQGRFRNRRIEFVATEPSSAQPTDTHQESAVSLATKQAASSVAEEAKEVLDATKDAVSK